MRVQFTLSKEEHEEIEKLMQDTKIRTKRDFLDNALTLFKWAIKEHKNGNTIASVQKMKITRNLLCRPCITLSQCKNESIMQKNI